MHVTVVCSGNICRSPMAEVVLRSALAEEGLGDRVTVDSAGTGAWHVGEGADSRTVATLHRHGLDGSSHVAAQFEAGWFDEADLVLAADAGHLRALQALARSDEERSRVRLLRSFDPAAVAAGELDLADPWYGDTEDFEVCYRDVRGAVPGVVAFVREGLGA
ncbi:low molecular weight protein-tyrosine-phosphatase [Lapillicoccus jejuensis]|uniref:protein-tyrosine-phosphatase n=1 Tax=Lapillicoccus jejuensis TaxID=402171 RepID=A0A542DYR0_9MICO|nr:low molecular weight protein-tyrosine-phosphatase [Lapillicoccus jejuensis]TQJ08186.1 protein tyrosine phosphatase [Lapillicoccus jejuensis]